MFQRLFCAARGSFTALFALSAIFSAVLAAAPSALAEDTKTDKPAGQEPSKDTPKIDEYAEAQKEIAGPAGNPECVWLGRRVVALLSRDDLDTAFRHLDMYDRFGCPSAHIQSSFRCIILNQSSINSKATDPNAPDSLNGRVQACWLNPTNPAPPPAPATPPATAANPANSH